jgi:hypothetical protein
MKYCISIIFVIYTYTVQAQLTLETSLNTGMNMTIKERYFHPESPLEGIGNRDHFNGVNAGANIGARFFIFDKQWSFGTSVGYLFRYHETGSKFIGSSSFFNEPLTDHFITIPLDIGYHFKFGLGFHAGVEASWYLGGKIGGNYAWAATREVLITPLVGISYTYKRCRFDLLYKHSLDPVYTATYYSRIAGQVNIDTITYRYHDLELRVVFRLHEFGEIKM